MSAILVSLIRVFKAIYKNSLYKYLILFGSFEDICSKDNKKNIHLIFEIIIRFFLIEKKTPVSRFSFEDKIIINIFQIFLLNISKVDHIIEKKSVLLNSMVIISDLSYNRY